MQSKTCSKCGASKTIDKFHANKTHKYGVSGNCKACVTEYSKLYNNRNVAKIAEYNKAYSQENKAALAERNKARYKTNKAEILEKVKAYSRANKVAIAERNKAWGKANQDHIAVYRQADKNKISVQGKAYRHANPEKMRVNDANRRARKRSAQGKHTAKEVKVLFVLQKGKCICCKTSIKDGYHVDHIYALSKDGANDKYNLQLLCQPCNQSKSAKDPITFMQSRGFLL